MTGANGLDGPREPVDPKQQEKRADSDETARRLATWSSRRWTELADRQGRGSEKPNTAGTAATQAVATGAGAARSSGDWPGRQTEGAGNQASHLGEVPDRG